MSHYFYPTICALPFDFYINAYSYFSLLTIKPHCVETRERVPHGAGKAHIFLNNSQIIGLYWSNTAIVQTQ